MSPTLEASEFMGKNYSEILHAIKNSGNDLTMKQMFDISEKLIKEQSDETMEWIQLTGVILHGNIKTLIVGDEVVSLSRAKVYVFSDSVLCFGKTNENPQSNIVWEDKLTWFKSSSQYRALDTIDGEPMEFEWNMFHVITTLELVLEVQKFMRNWANQNNSKDEFSSCRCSMTSYGETKTMKRNELPLPHMSLFAKRFPEGCWSFLGPGSETKWYSTDKQRKTRRKMGSSRWIDDDQIRRKRTPSFPSSESVLSRNAQK